MRIVVVSPPRSGNHWTKCLLSHIYGLKQMASRRGTKINPRRAKDDEDYESRMPDGTIIHLHAHYSTRFVSTLESLPAHIVTAVRDPYDVFLSYYHWVQNRSPKGEQGLQKAQKRPRSRMTGRPIDDPEVLAYLEEEFGALLANGNGWLHSGRAIPVRYEDLHAAPVATLQRLTDQIEPVALETIEQAVDDCQIDTYRQRHTGLAHSIRSGKVGESRQQLSEAHLRVFRDRWADLVTSLGYQVR